ncbi:MAG: hypothetical protein PHN56_00455 [Candidatus Nanoarchaeia archaeon]|nr:hypothetical protein [Candidatus Nanoarchaeia archaeon]
MNLLLSNKIHQTLSDKSHKSFFLPKALTTPRTEKTNKDIK